MAYNEHSCNHVTAQYHVLCSFVETHSLIYEVLDYMYVTQHLVEMPQANPGWSRYFDVNVNKINVNSH